MGPRDLAIADGLRLASGQGRAFLGWWMKELAGLVPEGLRERYHREPGRLLVVLEAQEASLQLVESGDAHEIGRLDLNADNGQAALTATLMKSFGHRIAEVVVRLPASQVMHRTMTLPGSVEENLRAVLGFEMDRPTPFKADKVHYDFEIAARDPEAKTIRVVLTAVPRQRLDELVARLERWGLSPNVVDVADQSGARTAYRGSINLLPSERRQRNGQRGSWLNWLLTVVAAGLLVAALMVPFQQKRQLVDQLTGEAAVAHEEARAVQALREEYEKALTASTFLVRKRRQKPATIDVLHELTRILPDDTWLNRLDMNQDEVKIRGESSAASALISIIEASPLFSETSFGAPVTQNPKTQAERFVVTTRLASGEDS